MAARPTMPGFGAGAAPVVEAVPVAGAEVAEAEAQAGPAPSRFRVGPAAAGARQAGRRPAAGTVPTASASGLVNSAPAKMSASGSASVSAWALAASPAPRPR